MTNSRRVRINFYLAALIFLACGNVCFGEPLKGGVSKIEDATTPEAGLVNASDFAKAPPMNAARPASDCYAAQSPKLSGGVNQFGNQSRLNGYGGQEEYWINWDEWRHRIAYAIWGPLQGAHIYGQTVVEYDVTRDHHIRITDVRTPDPSGNSGRMLANTIMGLNGNPILEFPAGSKQNIHHNLNQCVGPPTPVKLSRVLYAPGGTEHVINQW